MREPEHPFAPGTRVYHVSQQWHRKHMGGTASVVTSEGPYLDGSYEYTVQAGVDFSRRTGPENPETRPTRWNSTATRKA